MADAPEPDNDTPPIDPLTDLDAELGDDDEDDDTDEVGLEDVAAVADVLEALDEDGPDEELATLMRGYQPSTGKPPWATDAALWQRAVLAVGPEDEEAPPGAWLVVAHLYRVLGGELAEPTDE